MPTFYEFFAGGGMVRAGLGKGWECLFANDIDYKKAAAYQVNWKGNQFCRKDVRSIQTSELSECVNLVWASFPCQDLSLAGGGAGLRGNRSGTYWPFWTLMQNLISEGRAPDMILLENVCGTLTSHKGKDFLSICENYKKAGYEFGALVIDAVHFVAQSRPRLFILGVKNGLNIPKEIISAESIKNWHPSPVVRATENLSKQARAFWRWWNLPIPPKRKSILSDIIEQEPQSVEWHTEEETSRLLSMMSETNTKKVEEAKKLGQLVVGSVYKRTRRDDYGRKVQRAEVRFDGVAGCLRTPAGGSSRQLILIINGNRIQSRLLSTRETARLMGLPDNYQLPTNYNEAYHLTGDGVTVPVVRYIASNILEPIVKANARGRIAA